jgi:hypothetical protein
LGTTANFQGSYKFICLRTGRRITRKQFQELPMPASVIAAVKALADRDKQAGTMEFTDRYGNSFDDLDDANQPTDGAAGVDDGTTEGDTSGNNDKASHDEQREEENDEDSSGGDDEAPGIMLKIPGVPGTAAVEPEIPGVELEDLEPPEMDPYTTGVDLEIPGVGVDPPIPGVPSELPGVPSELPGVQGEEDGDDDDPPPTQDFGIDVDRDEPPPPILPRSEAATISSFQGSDSDSDDEDSDNENDGHDEEIPDDEEYHLTQ